MSQVTVPQPVRPAIPHTDALIQAAASGDTFAMGTLQTIVAMGRMQARAAQDAAAAAMPPAIEMPAARMSGNNTAPSARSVQIVNQTDLPLSVSQKPIPPPKDKKGYGWAWWKWAVPLGLMILGPLCGLVTYGLGSLVAVPIYAVTAGCFTCSLPFFLGVVWLAISSRGLWPKAAPPPPAATNGHNGK